MINESNIQSAILDYLLILEQQNKLFIHRSNNIVVFDPTKKIFRRLAKGQKGGYPDITVLKDGIFIGLEVKTKIGKQSKYQIEIQNQINQNGGKYFIVRSIQDVKNCLQ